MVYELISASSYLLHLNIIIVQVSDMVDKERQRGGESKTNALDPWVFLVGHLQHLDAGLYIL